MVDYVVKQLREEVLPKMEMVSGKQFDEKRLQKYLASSARAEENLVSVWNSARNRPSPIDAYFGGVYYVGPMFSAFRGLPECEQYYESLRAEVEDRIAQGRGPITPEGDMAEEKYRLVV